MADVFAGSVIGLLVGIIIGFLFALWLQTKIQRDAGALTPRQRYGLARLEQDDDDDGDAPAYLRQRNGERDLPQYPYCPPIVVLAAPRAQGPQVVAPGTTAIARQ